MRLIKIGETMINKDNISHIVKSNHVQPKAVLVMNNGIRFIVNGTVEDVAKKLSYQVTDLIVFNQVVHRGGEMSIEWIETDKHVCGAIFREHREDFCVFASYTAPEVNHRLGITKSYILTEWGFKDADEPLIKSIATKKSLKQKEYDYKYYIAVYRDKKD